MAPRVLLADDHRMIRQGLRRALEDLGVAVVGEAPDGEEAVRLAVALRPHVVLMDVSMPVLDGVEATERLRSRVPEVRVVVLTMHGDEDVVGRAQRAGAFAHLTEDCSLDDLAAVIGRAAEGRAPQAAATASPLSAREVEVLQLVTDGCSPVEVGQRLFVSQKTVKNHLASIYAKLGARDRTDAVVRALRLGLVRVG